MKSGDLTLAEAPATFTRLVDDPVCELKVLVSLEGAE
jgi:hypothetical protein